MAPGEFLGELEELVMLASIRRPDRARPGDRSGSLRPLLIVVVALASLVPALHAVRLDPIAALRS